MASLRSLATAAALLGGSVSALAPPVQKRAVPAQAQVINQKAWNVLPSVPEPDEYNASNVSLVSTLRVLPSH